jgi:hypothetical protein
VRNQILTVAMLAALSACAHAPATAPSSSTQPATTSAKEIPAEGDSLNTVRRKLGDGATEKLVSPTERVLSALYSGACPDLPSGPGNLSQPACGTGKVLTVRVRGDRAIVIEWGDPRGAP